MGCFGSSIHVFFFSVVGGVVLRALMLYGFVFKLHLHYEEIVPGREWLGFRSISDTIRSFSAAMGKSAVSFWNNALLYVITKEQSEASEAPLNK